MNRLKFGLLAGAVAFLASAEALAGLPVIPGAAGFGIDTPAGRGGKIYRVTNLAASGPGSLYECVAATGARVCIFEVSGIIQHDGMLSIRHPNITIAGQTAPAPGIMVRGGGLGIYASDVLVQHITVRPGDDPSESTVGLRDALAIAGQNGTSIKNVVVDHSSFSWSNDEIMEVWSTVDNVTLRHNIFSEPLNNTSPELAKTFNALVGSGTGRVSFIGNLFAHAADRSARSGAAQFAFVNNVVYDHGLTGSHLFSKGPVTLNSLVGNHYIGGPSTSSSAAAIRLAGEENSLVLGAKVFLDDNVRDSTDGERIIGESWSMVKNLSDLSQLVLQSQSPPTWPENLMARTTANDGVLSYVLANAGSRPAERFGVDARIVGHVKNRSGRIINCVVPNGTSACQVNAGGWPEYSYSRRTLELPSNPNGDSDGDGYTNLEEWLHDFADQVERQAGDARPKPPVISIE